MYEQEFKQLIKDSKELVQLSKKHNKINFETILSDLNSDPSHFIYEILQNAEDAGAKNVLFVLWEDCLQIEHDGRVFNFNDIEGITGIGISTKEFTQLS